MNMTSRNTKTVDESVCRLCGQHRAIEKDRVPKKKEDVSDRIKKVLGEILVIILLIAARDSTVIQTHIWHFLESELKLFSV